MKTRLGAGLILGGLALISHGQLPVWASNVTLWTAAVEVSPTPRALINLSSAELQTGESWAALQDAVHALSVLTDDRRSPVLVEKHRTLAYANANLGAEIEMLKKVRGDPRAIVIQGVP